MLVAAVSLCLNAFKHSLSLSLCLFLHTTNTYINGQKRLTITLIIMDLFYRKSSQTQFVIFHNVQKHKTNLLSQSVNTGTPSQVINSMSKYDHQTNTSKHLHQLTHSPRYIINTTIACLKQQQLQFATINTRQKFYKY